MQLLGLEPDIRAGVPNVAGGPIIEIARLSPVVPAARRDRADHADRRRSTTRCRTRRSRSSTRTSRCGTCRSSSTRCPARRRSRTLIDNTEWAQQAANPAAYAPFITRAGDHPVRARRPDRAEPDDARDHPGRRPRVDGRRCSATTSRSRRTRRCAQNPHTFLTNIDRAGRRRSRFAAQTADRDVLRQRRRDDDRPGRRGRLLRDADVDGPGGPRLLTLDGEGPALPGPSPSRARGACAPLGAWARLLAHPRGRVMNPNKALWEKGTSRASRRACGRAARRSSPDSASPRD